MNPPYTLFDTWDYYARSTPKAAGVRNAIGELAEELACRALGMVRQPIDGRKSFCTDALWDDKPVEIKSVGKNGRALIYKWRREKEMAEVGPGYRYVFVQHDCTIDKANGSEVADYLRDHPPRLLITTLGAINGVIGDAPPRKFKMFLGEDGIVNNRIGYNRKGYADGGWQFNLNKIPVQYTTRTCLQWRGEIITITLQHT